LSGLELALAAAALLIGATGTWSPCGFSMVETIGPGGHCGGRPTTLAACATFTPGAVAGGAATFGLLGLLGELVHGAGGTAAYLAAAGVALAAALADARGVPIVPQIRRQLPEHWRRTMPMPLAAALYGILLGLGFTTFVLSFGVWALAGISFAVGDPAASLVIGTAFGIGRAIPIALLAPLADRPIGIRAVELMAERPSLYRNARFGDAVALTGAAVVLAGTGVAGAAETTATGAADPTFGDGLLGWQRGDQRGVLRRGDREQLLPGTDPAVGGPFVAVLEKGAIRLLDRNTLAPIARYGAKGVDSVAVSSDWLVYRVKQKRGDVIKARRITHPLRPSKPRRLAQAKSPAQLGRPNVDGGLVVYAIAKRRKNKLVEQRVESGRRDSLLASRTSALSSASVQGKRVLYVLTTDKRQRLKLKSRSSKGDGRTLYSRGLKGPTLWSTELSRKRAYVTLLRGSGSKILSVKR
jgi:hypothetical protein